MQIEAMNAQWDALEDGAARAIGAAGTERRQKLAAAGGVLGALARVEVSFERKAAVVTFDDAGTTVEAVTAASADAGFPGAARG